MKTAIYPGTFDPVTNGHLSVLKRASNVFDSITLAVAVDNNKNQLFTLEERLQLLQESVKDMPNVQVEAFSGLLMEYVKKKQANAIIRGLRVVSDFEYEMQMAAFNKELYAGAETVFFTAATEYSFVSSSMIKSIAVLDGDISKFVPAVVNDALKRKYGFPLSKPTAEA